MSATDVSDYESEVNRIRHVAPYAIALIAYAKALASDKITFERKQSGWWVASPNNFIAFKVPKRWPNYIEFLVMGSDFHESPALTIHKQSGPWQRYNAFTLSKARQIGPAAAYIATAFDSSKSARRRAKSGLRELADVL